MTKFIVGQYEMPLAIMQTMADAEEMLLSFVEEDTYEDYLLDMETYILCNTHYDEEKYTFETFYGYHLTETEKGYWIQECHIFNN